MRSKDTGNIAKTVQQMTGQKPVVHADGDINYLMPTMQKLYNLIQPAMTTIEGNNLVYFNTNEQISDNAYPIQLIDLYHNASSTFSNFINLRRNMLIGNGLEPVNGDKKTLAFLNQQNEYGVKPLVTEFKLYFASCASSSTYDNMALKLGIAYTSLPAL